MGQPSEVFEEILNYVHRDSVFPKFTEHFLMKRKEEEGEEEDDPFDILSSFDTFPCNPECPAHRCFAF